MTSLDSSFIMVDNERVENEPVGDFTTLGPVPRVDIFFSLCILLSRIHLIYLVLLLHPMHMTGRIKVLKGNYAHKAAISLMGTAEYVV
jgi:hypothetical protein